MLQNFQAKLSDRAEPLNDLKSQAKDLQLAGFVSDPEMLNHQVRDVI